MTSAALPFDDDLEFAAPPAHHVRAGEVEREAGRRQTVQRFSDSARARRRHRASAPRGRLDDRELVDQAFELGDQVRRHEHRPPPGSAS